MTVRQATLPELIDLAAAEGFSSVTTTPWLVTGAGQPVAELRRRLDDSAISVGYIDGLSSPLPGTPEGATEEDCFSMAHALGAPALNVVHFNGPPVGFDEMAEAIGGVAERAQRQGLRILLEFLPGTGIPDFPTALELVRAAGAERAGVMLDTWHLARTGGGPAQLVGDAPSLVGGIQVSDRRAHQDEEPYVPMTGRYLPGDGDLPLIELLGPVIDCHPGLPVGVEVLNEELRDGPAERAAARAAEALRALLEALVVRAAKRSGIA
jgi:sugar phosphate isomerase/epimerase